MSSLSKQASSENGSFYVLQNPNSAGSSYHIGKLNLEEKDSEDRIGFFTTYDQSEEQTLGRNTAVLTASELKSYLKKRASSAELRLNPNFGGSSGYQSLFNDIQNQMKAGGLKKAVLFQSVKVEGTGFLSKSDFLSHMQTLLHNQAGGFLFGYYNPKDKRALLGITPEFLCRDFEGVKYTTAVAGTKSESDASDEWGMKLKEEHTLVKEGVDKSYKVVWSQTTVHKYGPLRHLKSEGALETSDSLRQVSSSLHPTAAVGTLPHEMCLDYKLGDLSSKERGHFGGYALLEGIKSPFSLVTIRGLEWSNGNAFACIGGGVLPESHFEDEWAELEKKWKTFRGLWQK